MINTFYIAVMAILLHALILGFILVGFPITRSRQGSSFYYSRMLTSVLSKNFPKINKLPFKTEAADDQTWNKIRTLNKPKR